MSLFKSEGCKHLTGINDTKHLTSEKEILTLPDEYSKEVYVPLVDPGKGLPINVEAKVGDHVKVGTLIGTRNMFGNLIPIYSPVSGVIKGEENILHGGLGRMAKHYVIENDFKYENVKVCEPFSLESDSDTIIDAMQKLGLVGLGGAGFPTFIKYKGVKDIDTIIINGVECEPFLTTDYNAMIKESEELFLGASLMMKAAHAQRALICFKQNKVRVYETLKDKVHEHPGLELKLVPDVYPMGWEKLLCKTVTGRTYEKLPAEAHVIINNAQTAIELAKSSKTGFITRSKMLTVTGEGLKENANVIVPIGTKVSEIVRFMGGYTIDEGVVLLGGPMCSRGLMNDNCAILPQNDAITVLRKLKRRTQQCLRCGACTDHCPTNLQPVEIKIAYEHKDMDRMMALKPTICIGCGLCSYVCPSQIEVNDFVKKAKALVMMEETKRKAAEAKKAEAAKPQGGKQ